MRILVTGGAGFLGSHLVDSLMRDSHEVIVCDNFITGRRVNIEQWIGHPNFSLIEQDIVNPIKVEKIDQIYHLASIASPAHYLSYPIETIETNTLGTINLLKLAEQNQARLVLASTSEIYGDPQVHPQEETYCGNVSPIGPRSCYDESKRVAESLAAAYNGKNNVSIGVARIFNTYGPRMDPNDGRVVPNFITQAIRGQPITIYGDGQQTRSFQYVTDLIDGLKKLMANKLVFGPVNLGHPDDITMLSLAQQIKLLLPHSTSEIEFKRLPTDDPRRRKPDIKRASDLLDWHPTVSLEIGLIKTLEYFIQELKIEVTGHKVRNELKSDLEE